MLHVGYVKERCTHSKCSEKKKKNIKNKENIFNLTVQYLEKYSSTIQQLAYRGWPQVNRQEELEEREETGDGRAEGSSAIGG